MHVPNNCQCFTMIRDPVQTKPLPLPLGYQRLERKPVTFHWLEPDQVTDYKITKTRMVVEFTARAIAFQPITGLLVLVFTQIQLTLLLMRIRIFPQLTVKNSFYHITRAPVPR